MFILAILYILLASQIYGKLYPSDTEQLGSSIWVDLASNDEIGIIRHAADSLRAHIHKSDCFKNAARALQQTCKSIDMDSEEKTKYAIRLTVCEITTAKMPVPYECRKISTMDGTSFLSDNRASTEDIGGCVESLGQIPQLWISYSGYFREVKAMCLAVRYSIEYENFHEFQKNMTQYHTKQSIILKKHQDELTEAHNQELARFSEIQEIYTGLIHEATSIEYSVSSLRKSLELISKETAELVTSSDKIIQQQTVLYEIQDQSKSTLEEYQDIIKGSLDSISSSINIWNKCIQSVIVRTQELSKISDDLEVKVIKSSERIDTVISRIDDVSYKFEQLEEIVTRGAKSIIKIQSSGIEEMQGLIKAFTNDMSSNLDTLQTAVKTTWSATMGDIETKGSRFQQEMSLIFDDATTEIQRLSLESQDRLRYLNQLVGEFEVRQVEIFNRIQAISQIWDLISEKMLFTRFILLFAFVMVGLLKGPQAASSVGFFISSEVTFIVIPLLFVMIGISIFKFCAWIGCFHNFSFRMLKSAQPGIKSRLHSLQYDEDHMDCYNLNMGEYFRDYHQPQTHLATSFQGNIGVAELPIIQTPATSRLIERDRVNAWEESFELTLGSCA